MAAEAVVKTFRTNKRQNPDRRVAAVSRIVVAAAFLTAAPIVRAQAPAAALVVMPNQVVNLTSGVYHYGSVTVHPRGTINVRGRVTLNVDGDVRLMAESVTYDDPDEGPYTVLERGTIAGFVFKYGTNGANGAGGIDGTPGHFTGSPGTIHNLQTADGGVFGGSGGDAPTGQLVSEEAVELTINAGGDVIVDGAVGLDTTFNDGFSGGRGGDGGAGGNGGLGLSHYGAPVVPESPVPLHREYANGGSGGNGGRGGNGARVGPVLESRLVVNAGHQFVLGATGQLDTTSRTSGGYGGGGGDGGAGNSGGQASVTLPVLWGNAGYGGHGGQGGYAGAGGNAGGIYIQAPTIALSGEIHQRGGEGGQGGAGARAGRAGSSGQPVGCCINGGDGGNGGAGGDGGNMFLRGMSIVNASAGSRAGGTGGYGGPGGFPWSFLDGDQGTFGADGSNGDSGAVATVTLVASTPLANGSFGEGLAFFKQSGGGAASLVDLSGNAVVELVTTESAPVVLTQLVSTAPTPMLLQLDYRFLSPTGGLRIVLGSAELLSISPTSVDSALGVPVVEPSPLEGFTRVRLVLTDPSVLGLVAVELHVRLLPGSIARAQVDNLTFEPVQPSPDDADADGFTVMQGDCDDADPAVHPGAAEQANGVDDDCDGTIDEGLDPDTTPPTTTVVALPAANASGWHGSDVTVMLSAVDPDADSGVEEIHYTLAGAQTGEATVSGSTAAIVVSAEGATAVTFFARDAAGNTETPRTMTLRIDKTAPALSCSASPSRLRPANHRLVAVTVDVAVTDALSGPAGFALLSVSSSEPDDGCGDGDTVHDIQGFDLGTADTSGQLRAERSGRGTGRVYTLRYEARDQAGHTAACEAAVMVPRRARSHGRGHDR